MKTIALPALLLVLAAPAQAATPQDVFFTRLSALCGKSFVGKMVTTDPIDATFADQPLVMHVKTCTADEVRIPFHVGEDRSRTWVVTRSATGLRLKHDHRHADGTQDAVSQYGGHTTSRGTASRQEFPVDQFSKDLFLRENSAASVTNVWALEAEPKKVFAYELRRAERHFRVEFDLSAGS